MKKFYSRFALSLALLSLVSLLGWPFTPNDAVAQDQTPSDETVRTVTVSGTGELNARPDTAIVTLGVETQAESANEALSQNNEQMAALIDALIEAGIPEEEIQTQSVRLNPQYADQPQPQQQTGPSEITGYVAVNTVQIRTENLDNIGEVLDAAVAAGSNRIEGISFEVSNPDELLQEARNSAWQDALQKAQQLAELAGAELGPVLNINATDQGPFPIVQESFAVADAARVPIQPGTQTVSTNLQVTWQLQ